MPKNYKLVYDHNSGSTDVQTGGKFNPNGLFGPIDPYMNTNMPSMFPPMYPGVGMMGPNNMQGPMLMQAMVTPGKPDISILPPNQAKGLVPGMMGMNMNQFPGMQMRAPSVGQAFVSPGGIQVVKPHLPLLNSPINNLIPFSQAPLTTGPFIKIPQLTPQSTLMVNSPKGTVIVRGEDNKIRDMFNNQKGQDVFNKYSQNTTDGAPSQLPPTVASPAPPKATPFSAGNDKVAVEPKVFKILANTELYIENQYSNKPFGDIVQLVEFSNNKQAGQEDKYNTFQPKIDLILLDLSELNSVTNANKWFNSTKNAGLVENNDMNVAWYAANTPYHGTFELDGPKAVIKLFFPKIKSEIYNKATGPSVAVGGSSGILANIMEVVRKASI
jgi:hypothetical protein